MKKRTQLGIFKTKGRLNYEANSKYRSPFQRDRDRIIHSASFRRLKHKTQVFVNTEGDHFRTRITHSIEVAQIARSISKYLNLNEDFVFDPDEAMSKPDSDSAKVLSATIDGVVQKRLTDALSKQRNENVRLTKESEFRSKYNLSDEQWEDFLSFAKNKTLQLDDIYYLMNRGKREQNIAQNANQEVTNQMKKVQQRPQSLASTGSSPEPQKSPEDSVFEEILGIDRTLQDVLGP